MDDKDIVRLRVKQERRAHPIMPWSLDDTDCVYLVNKGFWFAWSGWGLHVESMN